MYETLKPYTVLFITTIAAVFNPIQNVLWVLFATFAFNIFTGIIADVNVNKAKFSLNKAFMAIFQMAFLMALVYYLHGAFTALKMPSLGSESIKWIALLTVYFYTTNIIRNAKLVFPKNKLFAFLYEVLTTEIFNRLKSALMFNIDKK
ncbi:MAG: hypothetical protein WCL70_04125 [Paludibacter sp.]